MRAWGWTIVLGTLASAAVTGAAAWPRQDADLAAHEPRIEDLAFLEGVWRGSDGRNEWEAMYTSPDGGVVASVNKEMREGRTLTVDFEHFREVEGELVMTPYPHGKRAERDFPLYDLDREERRVVFENPEHDFPRRFTYHRVEDGRLTITLEGESGGKPMRLVLALERAGEKQHAADAEPLEAR